MTMCRNGLHDLELPNAIAAKGSCRECRKARNREYVSKKRQIAKIQEYSVPQDPRSKDWLSKAACKPEDCETFFDPMRWLEASKICARCPVQADCLEETVNIPWGYSAGMTPDQRREERRQRDVRATARLVNDDR